MKKLLVSFSGGRTSAFLARLTQIHPFFQQFELHYLFANTGKEMPETLDFVKRCDEEWGLGVKWLEAKVNPKQGKVTTYTEVSYETASRNGEPFAAVMAKYGLPSKFFPHCTREMKLRPMHAYMKHLGGEYLTAIGIRTDEKHRASRSDPTMIYPLIDLVPMDKKGINSFWQQQQQPFGLALPSYLGNCDFCFKKSRRKKLTIAKERPELVVWWSVAESAYVKQGRADKFDTRGGLYVDDYIDQAKGPFEPWVDEQPFDPKLDEESDCLCKST